ncbi:nuclear transport factor 2 family protein [Mycobacterium sp. 236(2023)]|uniref:nuclear transport factor 2 family protein n=1 Tax=Mycobacterium sp. 236(2023) TaxID=3038163 RepID=UPI00241513CB|nr:nuclear transport factor 2 family protein [Mycobacterium sp. 236(2023)]MDG4668035.1 nuclear transport factor 2 family protein [Mycobacterium sp. 236(2023)]
MAEERMTDGGTYQEILNLEHTFIEYLDNNDLDQLAALFQHGALELVINGTEVAASGAGVAGARDVLSAVSRPRPEGSFGRHFVANPIVDIHEDTRTATVRFRTILYYVSPGEPLHVLGLGRHEDELCHLDGTWRITRKRIIGDVRYSPPAGT